MAEAEEPWFAAVRDEFPSFGLGFAYGSAVFTQRGYTELQQSSAMTDLVFVVDDVATWHRENLERNGSHYSALRHLGPLVCTAVQQFGAGVYYNTGVRVGSRLVKYGVVSRSDFRADLEDWTSLYVSGRMHKPVRLLGRADPELQPPIEANLRSALVAALLMLPERFDEAQLFDTVCGISYAGDVRMGLGESSRKPTDIAVSQAGPLRALYAAPLAEAAASALLAQPSAGAHAQDVGLAARAQLVARLPACAQRELLTELAPLASPVRAAGAAAGDACGAWRGRVVEATDAVWRRCGQDAANEQLACALRRSLRRLVLRSSLAQTAKGIVTAGAATSLSYALAKIRRRQRRNARAEHDLRGERVG